jgi:hypothetical protein
MLATRVREFYRTARGRWGFVRHLMAKIGAFALMWTVGQKKKPLPVMRLPEALNSFEQL